MNRAPMGQRALMCLAMLGGLVLSATTLASPQWSADARFKAMDSNGDGRVSAVEHAASASMMFNKMDANRDGSVTATEMDASRKMMKDDKAGMGRDGKMMKGKPMPRPTMV